MVKFVTGHLSIPVATCCTSLGVAARAEPGSTRIATTGNIATLAKMAAIFAHKLPMRIPGGALQPWRTGPINGGRRRDPVTWLAAPNKS
jgi:hypothetical protein